MLHPRSHLAVRCRYPSAPFRVQRGHRALPLPLLPLLMGLLLLIVLSQAVLSPPSAWAQQRNDPGLRTQVDEGRVPGGSSGNVSDSEFWRQMRHGGEGTVSLPDQNAARLIQSDGDFWRTLRNGPVALYSAWLLIGMAILLCLFFAIRGRVALAHPPEGRTLTRFGGIARTGHWLLACSFIVLAISGLNMQYGRLFLPDLIGKASFGELSLALKYAHNYVAFAFILGLAWVLVAWALNNIPNRHDVIWLLKGGGLIGNSHPSSKKFNAGQKILFWLVIFFGISVSLSGWSLLFPFSTSFFADTFAAVNSIFATSLPTDLSPLQEQQYAQVWHGIVATLFIAMVMGHIYLGTIGMKGAFHAMGSGEVDVSWARQHHDLWAAEVEAAPKNQARKVSRSQAAE